MDRPPLPPVASETGARAHYRRKYKKNFLSHHGSVFLVHEIANSRQVMCSSMPQLMFDDADDS